MHEKHSVASLFIRTAFYNKKIQTLFFAIFLLFPSFESSLFFAPFLLLFCFSLFIFCLFTSLFFTQTNVLKIKLV